MGMTSISVAGRKTLLLVANVSHADTGDHHASAWTTGLFAAPLL